MEELEERVNKIEQRNKRVELDKRWETSITRIISISILTYIVVVIVLASFRISKPFLNAIIPTIGFVLSTQPLPFIKKAWIKKQSEIRN